MRRVLAAVTAAAMVALVGACGSSGGGGDAASGGPVTLEFAQWWGAELPAGDFQKIVDDFTTLNKGEAGWDTALDAYHPTAVLWRSHEALGQLLADSPRWRIVYSDQEFRIAEPR